MRGRAADRDVRDEQKRPDPVQTTSARLKAYAHSTRRDMLSLLRRQDRLRAADIAEALGVAASTASFHLRVLADAGLIEEAPEHARDRRDRVWVLRAPDAVHTTFSQRSVRLTTAEFDALADRIEGLISAAADAHDPDDTGSRAWQIAVLAADDQI
ncbi:helix-turn-helix domain-containing protein [Microbacterium saperdae]